ncbi:MurR/RpiR family transcriptional regulator [Rhodococcus sp. JVH1]|uniref:MurR/RpiR family transcriptional regulator n=1 Tax=Rhodococcus sp. JVH1 TaxID=745408 RepID=UPI0006852D33|nr:MurR/RpiR family transcriptional regulator [Rhodococcus sp. JVH1]
MSEIYLAAQALTASERRVAEVCVERPQDVAWGSVADLAAQSRTSGATVIRACRSLGFTGFGQLRDALLRELGASAHEPSPNRSGGPASAIVVLRTTLADMSGRLRTAPGALDPLAVDSAVHLLSAAERILVIGNGESALLGAVAAAMFLQSDRQAEAPSDALIQRLTAGRLSTPNVLLAVSLSGLNPITLGAVEATRATGGAHVVALSGTPESALIKSSDVGIAVGGGLVTALALLAGLQVAMSRGQTDSSTAVHQ